MSDRAGDLLDYIEASPTPYHAVTESVRRLRAVGFAEIAPGEPWSFSPGDRRYVSRADGSLIAFAVGTRSPASAGFHIVGAHTDSPNLRLKPLPESDAYGYRKLAVEVYGGALLHTWFDRDLGLAGRVSFAADGRVRTALVDLRRPLLRIPHLAIHLDREVREALRLNAQIHAVPVWGLEGGPPLRALLADELSAAHGPPVSPDAILAWELMCYDLQAPSRGGARGEFIWAPRLDNLASCHAALCALLDASDAAAPFTRVVALHDHEEVGSRTSGGAQSPFLQETLGRVVEGFKGGEPQGLARALAHSFLISADMAHAVHPNYADRHDGLHAPRIGGGPVIKTHASQAYSSDATTAGRFAALCREQGIEPQQFASRSDLACGSTIGPITAARLGIESVDVGNPMLSMHSCREMAGADDVEPMIRVLRGFFEVSDA